MIDLGITIKNADTTTRNGDHPHEKAHFKDYYHGKRYYGRDEEDFSDELETSCGCKDNKDE